MYDRARCPSHPGGILKRQYLEPLGLSVTDFAQALEVSRKTISKLLNERGSVTPEMALRLSQALDTSPELWLNLQQSFDLWTAAHQSRKWKSVKRLAA